ncbi:MAG: DNA-processing protein DprA [Candidatus Limnocylindrales bacterium]
MSEGSARAERQAWLALAAVEGIGPRTLGSLVAAGGGAANVLAHVRRHEWGWLPPDLPLARTVRANLAKAAPVAPFMRDTEELGLWLVTPLDAAYPPRLEVLPDPPPVLFGWGDPAALLAPAAVAVVGTRRPTLLGRALASDVAAALVAAGATVVSGLAIGIDGAAHAAALAAAGRTVGVIGAGHRQPGPRAHRALLRAMIAGGGAVISELPPSTEPTRGTYPRRNRLLSALSDGVAVIEAPARSGALNTAHHALEQGRGLFVAPGRPGDPATAGCLRLLHDTEARPLIGVRELVEDLGLAPARPLDVAGEAARDVPRDRHEALGCLSGGEREVADALCREPGGIDRLVELTGLPPGAVAGCLTLLGLRGWVRSIDAAYVPAGPLARS